jgi:hypothetical protein
MPSNSLSKDFQANSSQLNRLVTNKLKVNSLSLNDSNFTPDDILLVLNTLTIKNANLYADRIEFKVEDLQLTEWEQRTVGKAKVDYNKHYNFYKNDALEVLKNLWNDDYQDKYSFTLHSPNAHLSILTTDELFTNRYIIIKDLNVDNDLVTLYIESEEESPTIPEIQSVALKIVIDNNRKSLPSTLQTIFTNRSGNVEKEFISEMAKLIIDSMNVIKDTQFLVRRILDIIPNYIKDIGKIVSGENTIKFLTNNNPLNINRLSILLFNSQINYNNSILRSKRINAFIGLTSNAINLIEEEIKILNNMNSSVNSDPYYWRIIMVENLNDAKNNINTVLQTAII